MQDKIKDVIIVISFVFILLAVFFMNIIKKDEQISISERRKLAQFPKVLNKNITDDFEEYAVDQFIKRDFFRKIKYSFNTEIFRQKDNNKLFVKDDVIYKMEYPLNVEGVEKSVNKIKEIDSKYLQKMNVYYAIIPDKNYYLEDEHLKMDYKKLQNIVQQNLSNMKYIDLFSKLSVEDYYKTDIHWKQENIRKIVTEIEKGMNLKDTSKIKYQEKELGDFYGVYYGQIGKEIDSDKIKYLTSDVIENCSTYNYENREKGKVYDLEKYEESEDKYDVFLSGATPLISIENPNSSTNKELLLFRDSFGSSIAPLLLENYKKITLIDIRYISSDLLNEYIEFENQDVLFLYSSTILNQGIFK